MAIDPRSFPLNGNGTPESKIARIEAHLFHIWQRLADIEQEAKEKHKDREALLRMIGFRAILVLATILGALASSGSTHDSLIRRLWGIIV